MAWSCRKKKLVTARIAAGSRHARQTPGDAAPSRAPTVCTTRVARAVLVDVAK
ncbi:MAG: hypothetical protein INR71_16295 [Terriglobus roseus]|nr:hypothetical protein [Terriglobus roseus]